MANKKKQKRVFGRQVKILYPFCWMMIVPLMRFFIRVHFHGTHLINSNKHGCILLANHQSNVDPFLLNAPLMKQVQYFVSDSNMRSKMQKSIFWFFGGIAKTKFMHDFQSMRQAVSVVQGGGIVGIFPEGMASWDGNSLNIIDATAKLIKFLRVPVYSGQIYGSYFILPRWGNGRRDGRADIFYRLLFTPEQIKQFSIEKIREGIQDAIIVRTQLWQSERHYTYRGKRRAEYVERFLFLCPYCKEVSTITSQRTMISCTTCGPLADLDRYYHLQWITPQATRVVANPIMLSEHDRTLDDALDRALDGTPNDAPDRAPDDTPDRGMPHDTPDRALNRGAPHDVLHGTQDRGAPDDMPHGASDRAPNDAPHSALDRAPNEVLDDAPHSTSDRAPNDVPFTDLATWNAWQQQYWREYVGRQIEKNHTAKLSRNTIENRAADASLDRDIPLDQAAPRDQSASLEQGASFDQTASSDQAAPLGQAAPSDQSAPSNQTLRILPEEQAIIQVGRRQQALQFGGLFGISLTADGTIRYRALDRTAQQVAKGWPGATLDDRNNCTVIHSISEIVGCNVQNKELLEYYTGGTLYQISICNQRRNAYKWMLTIQCIRTIVERGGSPIT